MCLATIRDGPQRFKRTSASSEPILRQLTAATQSSGVSTCDSPRSDGSLNSIASYLNPLNTPTRSTPSRKARETEHRVLLQSVR